MTDWADDLSRVNELRAAVEAEPAAVSSCIEELLELARNSEWSVQRAAVDALGAGLVERPAAGVPELERLVRTAVDETVPSPGRWRNGLIAVANEAPEPARDAAIAGLQAVPHEQQADTGAASVARMLECIAVDSPALLGDRLEALRDISRTAPPRARVHLLGVHLTLLESHPAEVRPVLPDLLAEFEDGTGESRRVAADLLCGLATRPREGPDLVEAVIRWLATRPQEPREHRPWLRPRDSVMVPSLTDSPPSGVLGVTQVLARIAEETPSAVVSHCVDIATALTASESAPTDQWARSHLVRALAAVARQRPNEAVSIGDTASTLLGDSSEFVRYWAAQTLFALYPYRPDIVSPAVIGEMLTDENPDVRELGADVAVGCIADGVVDTDGVVAELRKALSAENGPRRRHALSVLASVVHHDPQAVQPVLPRLEPFIDSPLTASDTGAIFEAVAADDPTAVADYIPTLVDCLFTDAISVRTAAAEPLVTVGTVRPELLDEQLSVLVTAVDQPHGGIDAVGDVLATVGDRALDADRTVLEYVRAQSAASSVTVRRAATRCLGAFIEAGNGTEQPVQALLDRLDDTDQQVHEVALDALATHVAVTGSGSLIRACYRTGTDQWQANSAELLARATLYDGGWPSPEFQQWLATCLQETTGATRQSFIEAAGYICGQRVAEDALVAALLSCLDDEAVSDAAFSAVRDIVTQGETTIAPAELAPAVERALLDTDRVVPSSGLALFEHVAPHVDAPQGVADRLLGRLTESSGDVGQLSAALAALCATGVKLPPAEVVSVLENYATEKPVSARDWTCQNFARVLRECEGDKSLRDTFVPMAAEGSTDRRSTAFSVLASVAEEWPACLRPAADTLREGVRADAVSVSGPALSALVAVGRASPDVLYPVAGRVSTHRRSGDSIDMRRHQYEALALLAADGAAFAVPVVRVLRSGVLDNDTALSESALRATAECNDRRLIPVLRRLDTGVPDWESRPAHSRSPTEEEPNCIFGVVSEKRTLTAGDVLDELE